MLTSVTYTLPHAKKIARITGGPQQAPLNSEKNGIEGGLVSTPLFTFFIPSIIEYYFVPSV